MTLLRKRTAQISIIGAAAIFALYVRSKPDLVSQHIEEKSGTIESFTDSQNSSLGSNLKVDKIDKTNSLERVDLSRAPSLLDELKEEFPYQSFDCKIVPRSTPLVKDRSKPDTNQTKGLEGIFNSVGEVSMSELTNFTRIMQEQISLITSVNIKKMPLAIKLNKAGERGDIAALIDSLIFFDSLGTEFPIPKSDAFEPSNLLMAYLIESLKMDKTEFDVGCLSQLIRQLELASLAQTHAARYIISKPNEAEHVLDSIPKAQQRGVLSAAVAEVFEEGANVVGFETFFNYLSPELQEMVISLIKENGVGSLEQIEALGNSVSNQRLKAAIDELKASTAKELEENDDENDSVSESSEGSN